MSKDRTRVAHAHTALPALVLAAMTVAFLLVSIARAEDPPIVSTGQVGVGGNTASGQVGSNGKATACVNDQSSQADPSASDKTNSAKLNQGSCTKGGSSGDTGSQAGSQSSTGSRSKAPASKRGTSGSNRSGAASTVSAPNAVGLKITRVRPSTKGAGTMKHFRVLVTLKDLQGRLVRDAIVSVSKAPGARNTVSGTCSTFTNRLGLANVIVHVGKQSLGKRLFMKISARTPKARAVTLRSVRLPATG